MPEAGLGDDDTGEGRYLVFALGPDDYALDAGSVRELLRPPRLTRVPGAPPALLGLANLRGAALPVLDLRRIVAPDREPGTRPSRVVVAEAGETLGLLVDRVVAFSEGTVASGGDDAGEPRRLALSSGSGTARLIDLPALVARSFPDRARAVGRHVAGSASRAEDKRAEVERVSLVSFSAGGRSYALPLERVSEVMALLPDVFPVPRAGEAVLGVVALRGGVLPLMSLAVLLGLGGAAPGKDARVVVARVGGAEVGLVVDALGPILRLPPDDVDPVPDALRRGGGTAVDAICRVDGAGTLVSVLSADRMLEGANMGAASERAGADARRDADEGDAERFVVFEVGGENYGLPVSSVREVLRVPATMTRLPRSPDLVAGAVDVRGTVLAVIDQRKRFGLPPGEAGARRRIVVLDVAGTTAGLLVDGVSRLMRLPAAAVRPAPDFSGEAGAAVDRIATLANGDLLPIVDAGALLAGTEKAVRAATHRSAGGGTKAAPAA